MRPVPHSTNCLPQRRERLIVWRFVRSMGVWTAVPIARSPKCCSARNRIPERAWKTHDLRNRTIRLVQSGLALMRGGYRELLRYRRKQK